MLHCMSEKEYADINTLIESSQKRMETLPVNFKRSLGNSIHWESRLIGVRGARGTGKTTLLLQKAKELAHFTKAKMPNNRSIAEKKAFPLYVSLDNLWFYAHNPVELADSFVKLGGTHLFLDEIHKYHDWARVLKNIYDEYPELSIVFTGSSMLEILNARAD